MTLLRPGISTLRRLLQDELPSLRQAPVLVISSALGDNPDDVPKDVKKNIDDSCKFVQFTLAQQMGLRTVPSTISSAFPTLHDLDERRELLRRTGASSVVGVGSGVAIDLAKALGNEVEQVILIPSTYAGILASGTSNSLILDSVEEETLVPQASCSPDSLSVCPLDADKYMAPIDPDVAINASLSIILDACYRESKHPLLERLLSQTQNMLDEPSNLSHESATDLLYQSGQVVSFGLEKEDRSSPVTLAASLIPRIFPHVPIMTFYASLLPGISHLLSSQNSQLVSQELLDRIERLDTIPHLTVEDKSLEGFSVPDMALSHIQSNQTASKALDLPDSDLMEILEESIRVSK